MQQQSPIHSYLFNQTGHLLLANDTARDKCNLQGMHHEQAAKPALHAFCIVSISRQVESPLDDTGDDHKQYKLEQLLKHNGELDSHNVEHGVGQHAKGLAFCIPMVLPISKLLLYDLHSYKQDTREA